MFRSVLKFLAFNAFVFLLPIFCLAAWAWGSPDEKWLMRIAGLVLSPPCGAMWYCVLSRPLLGLRPRTSVALLAIVFGYAGIIFLLKFRIVGF